MSIISQVTYSRLIANSLYYIPALYSITVYSLRVRIVRCRGWKLCLFISQARISQAEMGVKFALKNILCSRVYSATVVTEVKALNAHLFHY